MLWLEIINSPHTNLQRKQIIYQAICQRLKFSPPSKGSKTLFGQFEKLYKNTGETLTTEQIKLANQFLFIVNKYGDYYYDDDLERRYYVTCKGRVYVLYFTNYYSPWYWTYGTFYPHKIDKEEINDYLSKDYQYDTLEDEFDEYHSKIKVKTAQNKQIKRDKRLNK